LLAQGGHYAKLIAMQTTNPTQFVDN